MSQSAPFVLRDAGTPASDVQEQRTAEIKDLRFRSLLGEEAWHSLPEPIRKRFSKRLGPLDVILYRGHVIETEISLLGRILAFAARAIGAPLPTRNGATGPAVVSVIEDPALGGQCWTRTYASSGRPHQVIRSMKCFHGATGLEERVGGGIGMALEVSVEDGALAFRSDRYFLDAGPVRIALPHIFSPGVMKIVHREEQDGWFSFHLTLTHPLFGCLVRQIAYFREA